MSVRGGDDPSTAPVTDDVDTVHVWLIRAGLSGPETVVLSAVLDDDEKRRAERLTLDSHRRRFIAAHGIARVIIGHRLGVRAERIGWQKGPHGKPELVGTSGRAQVNLSHSGDLAVLAMTSGRRCGVDVQKLPGEREAVRLAGRFFPERENTYVADGDSAAERVTRFARLWTRKEACLKVTGGRLVPGLRLPVQGRGDVLVHDPDGPLPGPYRARDLVVPQRFHAAVALDGSAPYRVVRHWWPPEFDHDGPDFEVPELDTMAVEKCSTVTSVVTSA
jgi:4'-phosphopantetheinyl transferase